MWLAVTYLHLPFDTWMVYQSVRLELLMSDGCTSFSHALPWRMTIAMNICSDTWQAGSDPASEYRPCLLNNQLHRYQRVKAVGPLSQVR